MRTANGLPGFEIAISESFGKADKIGLAPTKGIGNEGHKKK
jgi:hypothetical protein